MRGSGRWVVPLPYDLCRSAIPPLCKGRLGGVEASSTAVYLCEPRLTMVVTMVFDLPEPLLTKEGYDVVSARDQSCTTHNLVAPLLLLSRKNVDNDLRGGRGIPADDVRGLFLRACRT